LESKQSPEAKSRSTYFWNSSTPRATECKKGVNILFFIMFQWVFDGYHEKNDERRFEK
jgi:hypothetical protein